MKLSYIIHTLIILLLFTSSAYSYQWKLDPAHSEVRFEVKHILTTVTGHFTDFSGDIFFNPDKISESKFDFSVKVKSVDTNNGKRDNHIKSKDFFDSDTYSEMTFKSSRMTHKSGNMYELEGTMTIKDVSKNIMVPVEFFEPVQHPFDKGKHVAGFRTNFSVVRLDYHVGNGKFLNMGVVGDTVDIELAMEAFTKK